MDAFVVADVEHRGLTFGLDALTPRERDLFVIHDLDLYYEMEGGFADQVPNAPEKFDWLEDTLARIGDLGSLRIVRELRQLDGGVTLKSSALCDEYERRRETRWKLLEKYLSTEGVQLQW